MHHRTPSELLNTHYYDGKLTLPVGNLQDEIDRAAAISKEDRLKAYEELTTYLETKLNVFQKRNLTRIIQDFEVGSKANYDPINKIDAGDLLYLCYEKINDPDFEAIFLLQLEDMTTGMCSAGRNIRLFQVLTMVKE